jgi:hypothetical protein
MASPPRQTKGSVQEPPPKGPLWLDSIGKLVGLLMSVLFFVLATWYLVSGNAGAAVIGQQQVFYALLIILGGPIPYFFVSTATSVSLKTPLGMCTIGGGYAIAAFAAYFVTSLIQEREVWRRFTLDNLEQKIESKEIQIWGTAADVELVKEASENGKPFEFLCRFEENDAQITVTIQVPQPDGPKWIKQPLKRNGKRFETIEIYRHVGQSDNKADNSHDDRPAL